MTLQVRVVNPSKEQSVFEEIVWELDKIENETLPQVQLNHSEVGLNRVVYVCVTMTTTIQFHFPDVKFQESQSKILTVENTGLVWFLCYYGVHCLLYMSSLPVERSEVSYGFYVVLPVRLILIMCTMCTGGDH